MISLTDFVIESNRIEGIVRKPGSALTKRDVRAHERFLSLPNISVKDLEILVESIQTGEVLRRRVGLNMFIGIHRAPPGGPEIEKKLERLLYLMEGLGSYEMHLQYEHLHAFTDVNGRSGRALWLWQNGGETEIPFLRAFYYQTLEKFHADRNDGDINKAIDMFLLRRLFER